MIRLLVQLQNNQGYNRQLQKFGTQKLKYNSTNNEVSISVSETFLETLHFWNLL